MWGDRIGAAIGAIGGLVFIEVNAGGLPRPWAGVVRVSGALAFLAVLLFVGLRTRPRQASGDQPSRQPSPQPSPQPSWPGRAAMRTYWLAVLAEVLAIPLGAQVINRVFDQPKLVVLWVVAVVGMHFLPFARAFCAPVFIPLSWTLIGLAAAGAALTVGVDTGFAAATAVLAGVVLLAFAATAGVSRRPGGSVG